MTLLCKQQSYIFYSLSLINVSKQTLHSFGAKLQGFNTYRKVLEFDSCLEKYSIFKSALEMKSLFGKVFENWKLNGFQIYGTFHGAWKLYLKQSLNIQFLENEYQPWVQSSGPYFNIKTVFPGSLILRRWPWYIRPSHLDNGNSYIGQMASLSMQISILFLLLVFSDLLMIMPSKRMPLDLTDDKSTLVQVTVWCYQQAITAVHVDLKSMQKKIFNCHNHVKHYD